MTQLVDITGEITAAEMDQYFGGVYIQGERTYESGIGYKYKGAYNLPKPCNDLPLDIIQNNPINFEGFYCPTINIQVRGQ